MRLWKRYSVEIILLEFPKVNSTFTLLVLMPQHRTLKRCVEEYTQILNRNTQ